MSVYVESFKALITDIISRKFVVFVVATFLLYFGKISSEMWLYVAIGYMAANVLENISENYFPKK
jgi:hypothetical protein